MATYKPRLRAVADLGSIRRWIAKDNPTRTRTFVVEQTEHFQGPADQHLQHRVVSDLGSDIRTAVHGNYTIYNPLVGDDGRDLRPYQSYATRQDDAPVLQSAGGTGTCYRLERISQMAAVAECHCLSIASPREYDMQRWLEAGLTRAVKRGRLGVRTAGGRRFEVGDGSGELAQMRFHDTGAEWAFMRDPDVRLGELYMDGRITVEAGCIYDVIFLLMQDCRNQPAPLFLRAIDKVRFAARRWQQRNVAQRAQKNVAHHYDLDVALYGLFLDADLQYSCAYFEHPGQSLEDAQLAKKRHVAAKLLVEPRHRVLDIGCGWGGLACYLADVAGAGSVRGITLSAEQLAVALQRQSRLRRPADVAFALQDYRAVEGRFDRIVSVGMFEHVGVGFYDAFFQNCHRLLDDQGVMLLHTIGCSDGVGYVTPWVTKYIFPGGAIPAMSEIIPAIDRARLIVSDVEVLQLHYAWTLRAWRQRFQARREAARQLYDERFCRMWEFYLAAAEMAFRCEALNIFQIQISKSPAVTPPTRGYVEVREAALRSTEQRLSG